MRRSVAIVAIAVLALQCDTPEPNELELRESWSLSYDGGGNFDVRSGWIVLCQHEGVFGNDSATGESRWARMDLLSENFGAPTIADDRVYVCASGSKEDGGQPRGTLALDLATGETRWWSDFYAPEGVALAGDRVVGIGTMGGGTDAVVAALWVRDGSVAWIVDLPNLVAMSARPVVCGDVVVCAPGDALAGIDRVTGLVTWRDPPNELSMDIVGRGNSLATLGSDGKKGVVRGLEAGNGDLIWSIPLSAPASGIALTGKEVFVLDWEGQVLAIDPASKKVRWKVRYGSGDAADPLVLGDFVLVKRNTDSGKDLMETDLIALDRSDGALLGSVLPLGEMDGVAVAEGKLWHSDPLAASFKCYTLIRRK